MSKEKRCPRLCAWAVNVDHVATVRNARGGRHPDPVRAAHLAIEAGADGITAHLREDRRHIRDDDIVRLKAELTRPLNFEMAATPEMLALALKTVPHACCLVPEKREERTTEGGLDVVGAGEFPRALHRRTQGRRHPRVAVHRTRPGADRSFGAPRRRHRRAAYRHLLRARPRQRLAAGRAGGRSA